MCIRDRPKTTQVSAPISTNTYSDISTSDEYVTYTVANGDTVFGILNKFGITLDELLTLNPNPVSYTHLDVYKRQP